MPSPVGHGIMGWAVYRASRREGVRPAPGPAWLLFCLLAANAPDLDFVPGLIVGDPNRYHHGMFHSVGFMLALGLVLAVTGGRRLAGGTVRFLALFCALYGSHLLLDYFTYDGRAPFGIPLLWPFSREHFVAAWPLFGGIRHQVPGTDVGAFLASALSWHNLDRVVGEVLIVGPVALLAEWILRLRTKPSPGPIRSEPETRAGELSAHSGRTPERAVSATRPSAPSGGNRKGHGSEAGGGTIETKVVRT